VIGQAIMEACDDVDIEYRSTVVLLNYCLEYLRKKRIKRYERLTRFIHVSYVKT
jgi:hypothetical protein